MNRIDTITIGEVSDPETASMIESAIESGVATFQTVWSVSAFRRTALHSIKTSHPARFEVCSRILDKDPNGKYPRGLEKKIQLSWKKARKHIDNPLAQATNKLQGSVS